MAHVLLTYPIPALLVQPSVTQKAFMLHILEKV